MTAKSLYDPQTGIDTTTTALMEFDGGGMALIDCSFSLSFRATYEVVGSEASITVPNFLLGGQAAGDMPKRAILPVARRGKTRNGSRQAGNMYVSEVEAMSRRILGEDVFLLPAEDGLNNMRALDAVAASARTGQKVAALGQRSASRYTHDRRSPDRPTPAARHPASPPSPRTAPTRCAPAASTWGRSSACGR